MFFIFMSEFSIFFKVILFLASNFSYFIIHSLYNSWNFLISSVSLIFGSLLLWELFLIF